MKYESNMEIPKEIYVHEASAPELSWPKLNEYHVKYIRADLAELTWEDVRRLECLIDDVHREYKDNVPVPEREAYEEVLRRFYKEKDKQTDND